MFVFNQYTRMRVPLTGNNQTMDYFNLLIDVFYKFTVNETNIFVGLIFV